MGNFDFYLICYIRKKIPKILFFEYFLGQKTISKAVFSPDI